MKKSLYSIPMVIISLLYSLHVYGAYGDFRTRTSGNWNATSTWEYDNGSSWVPASYTPTYLDATIDILAGYSVTVTANVTVDELDVHGTMTINSGVVVTVEDGTGVDIDVDGTSSSHAYLNCSGIISNKGSVGTDSYGTITFTDGGWYKHNQNGGTIPGATWNTGSTCEVTGMTITDPITSSYNQTFYNFTWNCEGQTAVATCGGNLTTVNGNLRMKSTGSSSLKLSTTEPTILTIGGGFFLTGAYFIVTGGGAANRIIINGDSMKITAGTLTKQGSGTTDAIIRFNKSGTQYFEKTGGLISDYINFEVLSTSVLDLGTSVLGDPLYTSGYFSLASGAGLRTRHANGITSSGASGCIQVIGARSYSPGAHYTFYANGNQSTGNGLPSPITGSVTIGSSSNTTNLSFTNSTTINSLLVLINGTVATTNLSYGSSAILEYRGTSGQTTGNSEWPSNTVPNLKVNNSSGVTLNSGKTISTNLNLYSGALSLGNNNTLTLNGTISKTSGSLTGFIDHTSNIIFGGSGSTSLPQVLNGLNNLTINRAGATISLIGNVTVYGTMTMTAGSFVLSGGTLSYGSNGTLKYSGVYATTNNEFPSASGPFNLDVSNYVTLHADRTLNGAFILNTGQFSIGNHTLTLNGSLTKSSGTLLGGDLSNLIVGGTSVTPLDLPAVSLNNLTLNRASSGLRLIDNVTVTGTMTMTSGAVTLNGKTFSYGSNGILLYNGSSIQTTADGEFPGSSGPFSLIVENISGVNLHADRALNGNLSLIKGLFTIGAHMFTLNGALIYVDGDLTGGTNSHFYIGGSGGSISLKPITLQSLSLDREAGLDLSGAILVNGAFNLSRGSIRRYGQTMYGPTATLNYNGTITQTTSDEEFSKEDGPLHIAVSNPSDVSLHDDRTISGDLILNSGLFSIGPHTLTINGGITQIFGGLNGSPLSNLVFGENPLPTGLPGVQLNNLTIDRSSGIFMNGSVTVEGDLNINNGMFSVNSFTLTLNGPPISGTPSNLLTKNVSGLVFGGNSSGVQMPTSVTKLGFLVIMNPAGVSLESNITISGNVHVGSLFIMNEHELTGNGQFHLMPGAKLNIGHPNGVSGNIQLTGIKHLDSGADYEFDGNVNQVTNFLPTTIPNTIRSLYINNNTSSKVTLVNDMTLTGFLDVQHDGTFFIDPANTLIVDGDVVIHE